MPILRASWRAVPLLVAVLTLAGLLDALLLDGPAARALAWALLALPVGLSLWTLRRGLAGKN
jgi:hypothetical protein